MKIQSKTNVILTSAPIVEAIIDYAEHEKVDLIAIGTRGNLDIGRCYLKA